MARIIKSYELAKEPVKAHSKIKNGRSRIISGELYRAQLLCQQMIQEAQEVSSKKLDNARSQAKLLREEAMASAAQEAYDRVGKKALAIAQERNLWLVSKQKEVQLLASQIIKKITGHGISLDQKSQAKLYNEQIQILRNKRKWRIQCAVGAKEGWGKILEYLRELDIVVEENAEIKTGKVRVVTDAGSALCRESAILSELKKDSL